MASVLLLTDTALAIIAAVAPMIAADPAMKAYPMPEDTADVVVPRFFSARSALIASEETYSLPLIITASLFAIFPLHLPIPQLTPFRFHRI